MCNTQCMHVVEFHDVISVLPHKLHMHENSVLVLCFPLPPFLSFLLFTPPPPSSLPSQPPRPHPAEVTVTVVTVTVVTGHTVTTVTTGRMSRAEPPLRSTAPLSWTQLLKWPLMLTPPLTVKLRTHWGEGCGRLGGVFSAVWNIGYVHVHGNVQQIAAPLPD